MLARLRMVIKSALRKLSLDVVERSHPDGPTFLEDLPSTFFKQHQGLNLIVETIETFSWYSRQHEAPLSVNSDRKVPKDGQPVSSCHYQIDIIYAA